MVRRFIQEQEKQKYLIFHPFSNSMRSLNIGDNNIESVSTARLRVGKDVASSSTIRSSSSFRPSLDVDKDLFFWLDDSYFDAPGYTCRSIPPQGLVTLSLQPLLNLPNIEADTLTSMRK
jgi:hypothetical protein